MKKGRAVDIQRLQSDVEWALAQGLGARDVVPMLERLRRHAPAGSAAARFATVELAEALLHASPWRSARYAQESLLQEETDRAWAVLGLGMSLLGHYRAATRAFHRALRLAPGCSSYAHNLGHLLDAGLDRPADALRWLQQAWRSHPGDEEVAASYAHALIRVGREADARRVLASALGPDSEEAAALLGRWYTAREAGRGRPRP